jgi:hypothetical protein
MKNNIGILHFVLDMNKKQNDTKLQRKLRLAIKKEKRQKNVK